MVAKTTAPNMYNNFIVFLNMISDDLLIQYDPFSRPPNVEIAIKHAVIYHLDFLRSPHDMLSPD